VEEAEEEEEGDDLEAEYVGEADFGFLSARTKAG
jgi:hypothetical protein